MAAGEQKIRIDKLAIHRGKGVDVEYHVGVEDDEGGHLVKHGYHLNVGWETFMGKLSASEKQALVSIKDKILTYLRQQEPWLADYTEEDDL